MTGFDLKKECGRYYAYQSKLAEVEGTLSELQNMIYGLQAIRYDTHVTLSVSETRRINLIQKKDRYEAFRRLLEERIRLVEESFARMRNPEIRNLLWMAWVEKYSPEELARR